MNTNTPDHDGIINLFFQDLHRWRFDFVEKGLDWAHNQMDICSRKPVCAGHNSNLYQSEDGRVWDSSVRWNPTTKTHNNLLVEKVRSAGEFSRYVDREVRPEVDRVCKGGSLVSVGGMALVRSSDRPEENWGWTCPDPYSPAGSAGYAASSLAHNMRGVAFYDRVLSQRVAITAWFMERATTVTRGSLDVLDGDTREFYGKFAPEYEGYGSLPDVGSIHATLHTVLDRIAGVKGFTYSF